MSLALFLFLTTVAEIAQLIVRPADVYAKQQLGKTASQVAQEAFSRDNAIGCLLLLLNVALSIAEAYFIYYALTQSVGSKLLAIAAAILMVISVIVFIVKHHRTQSRIKAEKQLGNDPVLVVPEDFRGVILMRIFLTLPLTLYLVYLCALLVFGFHNFIPLP
jgi:hypothetical protein